MTNANAASNVVTPENYFWTRVERDLLTYLKGGPENELQNLAMAHHYGVPRENVRNAWAECRAEIAKRQGLAL